jgi:hypothetical protein
MRGTSACGQKNKPENFAQHYRASADEFRKQVSRIHFPEIHARLLQMAASSERVCNIAEGTKGVPEIESQPEAQEIPRRSHKDLAIKRPEDAVSQARRHVAEAEARIKRQEALIARLWITTTS